MLQKRKIPLRITAIVVGLTLIMAVTVYSAAGPFQRSVTLIDNGEEVFSGAISSATVNGVLMQNDITLNLGDEVSVPLDSRLLDNMVIEIFRNPPVTITAYGETRQLFTSMTTPIAILDQLGFDVSSNYIIYPWAYEPIELPAEITLIRTGYRYVEAEVKIPYRLFEKDNNLMPAGAYRFVIGGRSGQARRQYRIEYRDGVEYRRTVLYEQMLSYPEFALREVGTQGFVSPTTRWRQQSRAYGFTYSRSFIAEATAYDPTIRGNRPLPITATGTVARRGVVATDPRVIPMGTRMYITCPYGTWTYGFAIAGDTGGAIRGYKVDLFMCTRTEALSFGRRRAKVYIIDDVR